MNLWLYYKKNLLWTFFSTKWMVFYEHLVAKFIIAMQYKILSTLKTCPTINALFYIPIRKSFIFAAITNNPITGTTCTYTYMYLSLLQMAVGIHCFLNFLHIKQTSQYLNKMYILCFKFPSPCVIDLIIFMDWTYMTWGFMYWSKRGVLGKDSLRYVHRKNCILT